jgi:hypothetical protein
MNEPANPSKQSKRQPGWAVAASALLLLFSITPDVQARSKPKTIPTVIVGEIAYSANCNGDVCYIDASDPRTRKTLWTEHIYSVTIDSRTDRYEQTVYPWSLRHEGGSLVLKNERGAVYSLDLSTRKVTRTK